MFIKIVIDIVRFSSNITSQYVKELSEADRNLIHKVMCEVANLQAFRQHLKNCGGYRIRTDDPLRARQVL